MSAGLMGEALRAAFTAAGPFLIVFFLVGAVLGVLQAGTGVQDPSATQATKLGVLGLLLALAGPWVLGLLVNFTRGMWMDLGRFLR